ncbi:MAG: hypothetical protein ACFFAV_16605 [Candidatus Hermodarchaeota archaeon]
MGAGKVFCILGGIVTLLATFLFSFVTNGFGLGFVLNIPALFSSGDVVVIIMAVVFIIFLLAGLFIILGVKSRAIAIIGAILAIVVGVYWMLSLAGVLPIQVSQFVIMFLHVDLYPPFIPVNVTLGPFGWGLGLYLLVGGGVLGLIGGIMGPDNF